MRILPRTLTQPATEPVTLAQLRAQVVADGNADDALLLSYLITARELVEEWLGRALVPRTVTAVFEEWPSMCGSRTIELLMPVSSVDAVTYTNAAGSVVAWTDFVARQSQGGVMSVRPKAGTSWPDLGDDPVITLTATAGFDLVPEPIVTAIVQLAAYLYADRDGLGDPDGGIGKLPPTSRALIRPWRWRLLG